MNKGASPSATGPAPFGLSPASGSQAEPLVPSAADRRKIEAVLFCAGRERFTIDECERLAKDLGAHDSMTFDLVGPSGRLGAKWLDAYYGLFQLDRDKDKCLSTAQFAYVADIHCENLSWPAQALETAEPPSGDHD